MLSHHVDERNAPAAIEVLRGVRRARAETPAEVERLIALTSHELLELAPAGTVDAWLQGRLMNAGKLLPAVMSYDRRAVAGASPPPEHQGIRYLRASGSELAAVHNCLVLLHARRSDDATLLRYLSGAPSDDDLTDIASTLANAPSNAVPAPASSAFSGPDVGVDSHPVGCGIQTRAAPPRIFTATLRSQLRGAYMHCTRALRSVRIPVPGAVPVSTLPFPSRVLR